MTEDFLAGRNPVREALQSNRPLNKILISESMSQGMSGEIRALAKKNGVPVQRVKSNLLDRTAQGINHQGVVAVASSKGYVDIDEILNNKPGEEHNFIAVLDEIKDPQNLGAVIRSADAAGVNGIILPKHRSAGLTAAAAKASAGAIEYVPVSRVTNISQVIDYLKECGFWIIGAHGQGETIYWNVDFNCPVAVIIGSEGKGLSKLVCKKCDILTRLPMAGQLNSLNASVAAGLLFYEVIRQRRRANNE